MMWFHGLNEITLLGAYYKMLLVMFEMSWSKLHEPLVQCNEEKAQVLEQRVYS